MLLPRNLQLLFNSTVASRGHYNVWCSFCRHYQTPSFLLNESAFHSTNISSLKSLHVLDKAVYPSYHRSISTSFVRPARGSRIKPADFDPYPINPDLYPDSLHISEELDEIATPAARRKLSGNGDLKDLMENSATFSEAQPRTADDRWTTDVYTDAPQYKRIRKRDQAEKVPRPQVEPKLTSIVLFPGQGSQFVGMGAKLLDYPNVREIYGVASDILGYDLLKLCLEGPEKELARTVRCQVAIFVTQVAALEKLKEDYPLVCEFSPVSMLFFSSTQPGFKI